MAMENRYFQVFVEIEQPWCTHKAWEPVIKDIILFEQPTMPSADDIYKAVRKTSSLALNINITNINIISHCDFLTFMGGSKDWQASDDTDNQKDMSMDKDITQQVFKGQAKWYKWAVVDTAGLIRLFINKPILNDAGVWRARFTGSKWQGDFIERHQYGTICTDAGSGYRYEGDVRGDFAILRRKAGV